MTPLPPYLDKTGIWCVNPVALKQDYQIHPTNSSSRSEITEKKRIIMNNRQIKNIYIRKIVF